MNAKEPPWWLVNIETGNKPLPEPVLVQANSASLDPNELTP